MMLHGKTELRPNASMTSSGLRSPGDGGQSPSGNGRIHNNSEFSESVPVKRGQHYYELHKSTFEQKSPTKQETFRSASQEELDKLLAGLDKLTETLPDLSSVRSYSALSGVEKTSNGTAKRDVVRSPDLQFSLIRPSVIAKQASALQSRDTYDSSPRNDFLTSTMTSAMATASATSQPYHTRTDSKPFSYIRTSGPNSRNPSRNISRASSKEVLGQPGLESPGLLRKIMGGPATESDSGSRPLSPAVTASR